MRTNMNNRLSAARRARGFSLIEALVALLVLSFGMLALASFQLTLSRNSDLAKQRTEATRLAQQKMEQLRAYARVDTHAALPHIVNYTDDVVSGADAVTSNATFTRTWTVTANASNTEKAVNVTVDWSDRTGADQRVQLFSVISKYDPQDIGSLSTFVPGAAGNRLRPKNRNINVPYPAVTLAQGDRSAFTPPPGNVIYIFDNNSGNIIGSCTPVAYTLASYSGTASTVTITTTLAHGFSVGDSVVIAGASAAFDGTFVVTGSPSTTTFTYTVATAFATPTAGVGGTATKVVALTEGIDLAAISGLSCSNFNAYLLAGYVRFDTSNNPTGNEPGTLGANNDTLPLSVTTPLSLDTSNVGAGPAMVCYAQRQKIVTTNSTQTTITAISRSGSVVTVTAAGHGFVTGDVVAINQVASPPAFNGAFTVTSAPTANTFTYRLPPPLPAATTGTIVNAFAKKVERLTIPETSTVAGYTGVMARFVSYACIMTPVDHDGNASTPNRWWAGSP